MHRKGCPNEVLHEGSRARAIRLNEGKVNLTDNHIDDVLDKGYKELYKKVHPTEVSYSKREYRPRKKKMFRLPLRKNRPFSILQGYL